jgi:hypothetical protein
VGVRTFTTTYRLIKNHHISEIFSSSGESEFSLKRRPFGHFCSLPIKSSVKTSVLCNGSELHRSKKLLVVYSGEVRRVYRGMPCCCKIAHRVLREKQKVSDICKKSDICNPLPTSWLRDSFAYGRRYEILVLNNLVMSILVLSCSSTT